MPESAWLLPTGEYIELGDFSHAEIVIKFLTGLFKVDDALAKYCQSDLMKFIDRQSTYKKLDYESVVEDYAILCLRWIKLGNAYNYNDNYTIIIADYDTLSLVAEHYKNIGYVVNKVVITNHVYESIEDYEYRKLGRVSDIILMGTENYN